MIILRYLVDYSIPIRILLNWGMRLEGSGELVIRGVLCRITGIMIYHLNRGMYTA